MKHATQETVTSRQSKKSRRFHWLWQRIDLGKIFIIIKSVRILFQIRAKWVSSTTEALTEHITLTYAIYATTMRHIVLYPEIVSIIASPCAGTSESFAVL